MFLEHTESKRDKESKKKNNSVIQMNTFGDNRRSVCLSSSFWMYSSMWTTSMSCPETGETNCNYVKLVFISAGKTVFLQETWRCHSRFSSAFNDVKDYLACWYQTVHIVFQWHYFCSVQWFWSAKGQMLVCMQPKQQLGRLCLQASPAVKQEPTMLLHRIPNQSDITGIVLLHAEYI